MNCCSGYSSVQDAINKVRCFKGNNNCCCLGNQNTSGTVSITIGSVTTGEPGSEAIVTNSGTPQNVILNFTIPRGETGASPSIEAGSVTTGLPGSEAQVEVIPQN